MPLVSKSVRVHTQLMKIFTLLLLCLSLSLPALAQENGKERLAELTEMANSYGSHLAYAQARMLANKLDQTDGTQSYKLSRYSLRSDLYGGFHLGSDQFKGDLDLFTGKRAIDESLQLESIDALEDELKRRTVELQEIVPLQIRSHPWEEMLQELKPGPEIAGAMGMVPHDHLAVLFYDAKTIKEMEAAFQELAAGANALFDLSSSLSIRAQIAQRLGIDQFQELEALMGETVFVSEDLDFFPGTHYALIFQGDAASRLGANLLMKAPAQGRIGGYFVIASSQQLWDRIEKVHQGSSPSMADSLDFQYANAVLEPKRDGLVYLSEAFILKLVSPGHRINAARRLGAIEKLVNRQYAVLAYRCLEGSWPRTFAQIVSEGYLKAAPEDRSFTISPEGIVEHKVWGSLYQLKSLSDVPLTRVTPDEKELYERFARGYQSFWRTFFDPIGVAFKVDAELNFHTIILPLIDNSEYRNLSAIAGGEPIEFDSFQRPLLGGPVSLAMRFNLGDFLLMFDGRTNLDPAARAAREDKINQMFQKEAKLDPPVDLFALVGDEMAVTLHSDFDPTHQWNIDQLPISFSFQLLDKENFRRAARAAIGSAKLTMAQASESEVEYHILPLFSDIKIYLLYHQDFLHFTFNQPTMESLCRATEAKASAIELPGEGHLEPAQNLLWRGDFAELDQVRSFLSGVRNNRRAHEQMVHAAGYMLDVSLLEEALGRPGSAQGYLTRPPQRMYGVPLSIARGKVRYGGLALEEIDWTFRYRSAGEPEKDGKVTLEALVERHSDGKAEEAMKNLRSLAVGLRFTPEGLSTRVVVNNPRMKSPEKAPPSAPVGPNKKGWMMGFGAVLLALPMIVIARR